MGLVVDRKSSLIRLLLAARVGKSQVFKEKEKTTLPKGWFLLQISGLLEVLGVLGIKKQPINTITGEDHVKPAPLGQAAGRIATEAGRIDRFFKKGWSGHSTDS